MARTLVQIGSPTVVAAGTSGNKTLPKVRAGSTLICYVGQTSSGATTYTVSDDKGNTWERIGQKFHAANSRYAEIWRAKNVAPGDTIITVGASASATYRFAPVEWRGLHPTADTDQNSSLEEAGSPTSHNSSADGTVIDTAANVLILTAGTMLASGTTLTPGTNYTRVPSSSEQVMWQYRDSDSALANERGPWTSATGSNGANTIVSLLGATDTITITSPDHSQSYQRHVTNNNHTFTVAGTYTGTPTAIEVSSNGTDWSTLDAAPAGGNFTGQITLNAGQYTLYVRFSNATTVRDSRSLISIGDVVLGVGQSNAEGRLTNVQTYTHSGGLKGTKFQEGATACAELVDPTDPDTSNGSFWPHVAKEWMEDQGVPLCVITAGEPSTGLVTGSAEWAAPAGTAYAAALARVVASGVNAVRYVIKYQGEQDAGASVARAAYRDAAIAEANGYAASIAGAPKTIIFQIGSSDGAASNVRLAISDSWDSGGNIIGGPCIYDHSNDVHPTSGGNPDATGLLEARRIWAAMKGHLAGTSIGRGPKKVRATYNGPRTKVTVYFDKTLKTGLTHTPSGFTVTGAGSAATIDSISYGADGKSVVLNLAAAAAVPILVSMGIGNSTAGKTFPQGEDLAVPSAATINLPAEPFSDLTPSSSVMRSDRINIANRISL